jgi:ABC-2 type transport system permease protein
MAILATERERGTLRRLLMSPLRPAAYFMGIVLALAVVAAVQTVIVYAIAWPLGARFHGSLWLGAAVLALCVLGYVGLGFVFGARWARSADDISGPLSAFGVPLLVLGGTFFPMQLIPDFMMPVVRWNPVLHMTEALKAVGARGAGAADIGGDLAFLAIFGAVALALGALSYRRMLADERRGG